MLTSYVIIILTLCISGDVTTKHCRPKNQNLTLFIWGQIFIWGLFVSTVEPCWVVTEWNSGPVQCLDLLFVYNLIEQVLHFGLLWQLSITGTQLCSIWPHRPWELLLKTKFILFSQHILVVLPQLRVGLWLIYGSLLDIVLLFV